MDTKALVALEMALLPRLNELVWTDDRTKAEDTEMAELRMRLGEARKRWRAHEDLATVMLICVGMALLLLLGLAIMVAIL